MTENEEIPCKGCPRCKSREIHREPDWDEEAGRVFDCSCNDCGHEWGE